MVDLANLTLAEASRAIAARRLSSVELVEATLARIEAYDARLNSHVTVMAESALEAARAADAEIGAGRRRGPLHGVTVALKDIYDTEGVRTAGGSETQQQPRAEEGRGDGAPVEGGGRGHYRQARYA